MVGKVIWMCVARRPLMSLLSCSVLPMALTSRSVRRIAAREMRQFGRLAPLAFINTYRRVHSVILNTDASEFAGAVLSSHTTSDDITVLLGAARYNGGEFHPDSTMVRAFVKERPWRVAISHPWAREAHIKILEAAAILLAVRWMVQTYGGGYRVVLLSDSAVFLGVLATGRSLRPTMMRYAMHVSAVLLAYDVELILVHVLTDAS